MERKGSSFDMPLWESSEEPVLPVEIKPERVEAKTNREKKQETGEKIRRAVEISDKNLMRGVGAVAGAAMIGAITAPAHPIIGAGALAVAGAKLGGKLYEKMEEEYRRGQERERARYYRELEDYARAFENNAR